MTAYILNLSCPDRQGIVHAVSGFLLERQGNIEEAAQYNDHDTGLFFMRVQFACDAVKQDELRTQRLLAHGIAGELHAHEEQTCVVVVVLGGFFDVAFAF